MSLWTTLLYRRIASSVSSLCYLIKAIVLSPAVHPGRSKTSFRRVCISTAVRGSRSCYTSSHMMRQFLCTYEGIVVRSVCNQPLWGDRIPSAYHSSVSSNLGGRFYRWLCIYENTGTSDFIPSLIHSSSPVDAYLGISGLHRVPVQKSGEMIWYT